ncbi:MAG TPA: hypothetical protein VIG06_17595 [Kofleriaceae bacterium]|jgi:hypothetical protein
MGPGIVALAACALAGCRFDPDLGAGDFVIVDAAAGDARSRSTTPRRSG